MATVELKCCDVYPQRTSVRNKIVKVRVTIEIDGQNMVFAPAIDASPQAIERLIGFIDKGLKPPTPQKRKVTK